MASEKTDELYRLLLIRIPEGVLCRDRIQKYEYGLHCYQDAGYLYRVTDLRIEDLVDEMLAILSDRDAIIQKKEMERAQSVLNDIYENGL